MKKDHDALSNRPAAVAGTFYPSEADSLKNEISRCFDQVPVSDSASGAQALILPHAGFMYSGPVAAHGISRISEKQRDPLVFLFGSSHRYHFKGAALYTRGNYETPLGEAPVALDVCRGILDASSEFAQGNFENPFSDHSEVHYDEHSLEVLVPFLQYHFKNQFRLLPVMLGFRSVRESFSTADYLFSFIENRRRHLPHENIIFIASSDFSHFPAYDDAVKTDYETFEYIKALDVKGLVRHEKEASSKVSGLSTTMCGWPAASVVMRLIERLKKSGHSLNLTDKYYKNSGDTAVGSKNQVVGYWSVVFSP